jgi:alkanesulfonate monooxygenase SsuD/methylene tetrahydromethanopterin reductase-like flavin-dependent oxidoreductase (luciferase family)
VTLAGLARETRRIRLGTMVTSATFRLPGPLAISVAQVDAMSGGRVELGIGAGWYEIEHRSYGVPFPALGERFDRLAEQLAVIDGLWRTPVGQTFSYDGRFYPIEDSPALPKPVQVPRPPIIVGGRGRRRTPELAARYADELNVPFRPVAVTGAVFDNARAVARSAGRTSPLIYSVAQTVCVGRDDAEVARRAANIGREVDEMRENGLCGSPAEIVDKLGRIADSGVERFYLQVLDLADLDHLRLVAEEVQPHAPGR